MYYGEGAPGDAAFVVVDTGTKELDKSYFRFSGYPGGIRKTAAGEMRESFPERLIEEAVRGMLPKSRLGRAQFLTGELGG